WLDKPQKIDVRNSYDGSLIDTVPRADATDVERALQSAERGAKAMAKLTAFERWKILHAAAEKIAARVEELGTLISKEEGKILAEGRAEALRAVDTMMESAEEAKRVHGETVALDAAAHGRGKLGVTLRVPCGVVVAISPFNFPLNLVCHKVGPAIAGGNAVRSEEHTSELSHGSISYAVFCLKKKNLAGPGEVLGLIDSLYTVPYELIAEIVDDARVAMISRKDLQQLLNDDRATCLQLAQLLGH